MAPPAVLQADASTHGPASDLCFMIPIEDDLFVEFEECFAITISLSGTDGLMVSIADDASSSLCCIVDDDSEFRKNFPFSGNWPGEAMWVGRMHVCHHNYYSTKKLIFSRFFSHDKLKANGYSNAGSVFTKF